LPQSTGAFSRLLRDLSVAAKIVNRDIRRAGLLNIFGATGEVNVQGEVQQKLDLLAHKEFVRALRRGGECCLIGSEEHAEAIPINTNADSDGQYIVLLDPLDGSSNIDVNVSVGTTFSVLKRSPSSQSHRDPVADVLQPGYQQVAAGYVVYGSSTILVYSVGHGVHGFTLDPLIGAYVLSHENIRMPEQGKYYSVNEGYRDSFPEPYQRYIDGLRHGALGRPYSSRYIGSMVADFHRTLLKGGVFLYPPTKENPAGKLRLLYEANPIAYLAEQAGGVATDGQRRMLSIMPESIHQRTPLVVGGKVEMAEWERYSAGL
jgi:fructose-1,6-bisphosphatase I